MDKYNCLIKAIEITKEYARGGGASISGTLESAYEMLLKLSEEAKE